MDNYNKEYKAKIKVNNKIYFKIRFNNFKEVMSLFIHFKGKILN